MLLTKALNHYLVKQIMDVLKRFCTLKPLDAEHTTIRLTEGKNIIGRNKECGIRDTRCSKRQIELNLNSKKNVVDAKILGQNPCGINGVMVMSDKELPLYHGDIIEVVYGRHPYKVVFDPSPSAILENGHEDVQTASIQQWDFIENRNLVIFSSAGLKASPKIAAYDMDGTIIKTKSGNVFPKNIDDWQIIYAEVPEKLKRLHEDDYKICFFTNQSGIGNGKVAMEDFKQKIERIVEKLDIPVQVFISTKFGYHRKPMPGMWEYLIKEKNENIEVQLEKCFFVGDAAGRPAIGNGTIKRRKDHSLADRLFALNIGISFYTPEEHFLGARSEPWNKPEFDPARLNLLVPQYEPENTLVPVQGCEMIILVGLPGAGKSHYCKQTLAPLGYIIVNSDTLGSVKNCLKVCEQALSASKSCVVDNTNVDAESRKKFIELAKSYDVPCRCFVMNAATAQVKHNIVFRELTDEKHSKINDMVFNMMKKKYKAPTLEEGFTDIIKVNIKPTFKSEEDKKLYSLYLVEK